MAAMDIVAERRIAEAIAEGAFADLPGQGRPLELDDDRDVPSELRLGYRILRNAGVLPEELQVRRDLATLSGLIAACIDPSEREELCRRQARRRFRLQQLVERRGAPGLSLELLERLADRDRGRTDRHPSAPGRARESLGEGCG